MTLNEFHHLLITDDDESDDLSMMINAIRKSNGVKNTEFLIDAY